MFEMVKIAGAQQQQEILDELTQSILEVAERTGNFRLSAVTAGVAQEISDDTGFAVVILRGKYDPKAVEAWARAEDAASVGVTDGITSIAPDREILILMPSDDRLVFMASANHEQLPTQKLTGALRGGGGGLATNAQMQKLVESVNTSLPLWSVIQVSDNYKQAEPLAPFDVVRITAQRQNDKLALSAQATGKDAQAIKQVVDHLNTELAGALTESQELAATLPHLAPIVEFMKSLTITADGATAKATATVQETMVMLAPMFGFGWREARVQGEIEEMEVPPAAPQAEPGL
jgi:hypothetical protein